VKILCWCNFIIAFDKSINEIMSKDKVGLKSQRSIYDFIIAQNFTSYSKNHTVRTPFQSLLKKFKGL
jgi:hypothetical protein